MLKARDLLFVYSGVVTLGLVCTIVLGAHKTTDAHFDQITVHRINVVEPDGTVRMVLSDRTEFPGWYYRGKEYPRPDRDATGMLFNDEEGTENGGLIFGGKRDKDGKASSYGHLSFDQYQGDQTMVLESDHNGPEESVSYGINDDTRSHPMTPEVVAEWEVVAKMPDGPERTAAKEAWFRKYPGGLVSRAFLGRELDKGVALLLKDQQGRARLVVSVAPDGEPSIRFLGENGKVVRTIEGHQP